MPSSPDAYVSTSSGFAGIGGESATALAVVRRRRQPRSFKNQYWDVLREKTFGVIFWKRYCSSFRIGKRGALAVVSPSVDPCALPNLELGSLLEYYRDTGPCGPLPLSPSSSQSRRQQLPSGDPLDGPLEPPSSGGRSDGPFSPFRSPRRSVPRGGVSITTLRSASPRNQQLRTLFADADEVDMPQPRRRFDRFSPRGAKVGPHSLFPSGGIPQWGIENRMPERGTLFKLSTAASLCSKPREDAHPMLLAVQGQQQDLVPSQEREVESTRLARLHEELRWKEHRRGEWAQAPQIHRPVGEESALSRASRQMFIMDGNLGELQESNKHSAEEFGRVVRLMDPENSGVISPDAFIPLMFWLGLTRRRSAALATLQLAMGPSPISIASFMQNARHVEVQLRLVEGLRRLARRESTEQPCEFITDRARLRRWFYSMNRDVSGCVDIIEVQNLLARMEVTSDRKALFRYLSYFADLRLPHLETTPASPKNPAADTARGQGGPLQKKFGFQDFSSVLCRCVITWCLHRVLGLCKPPELNGSGSPTHADGEVRRGSGSLTHADIDHHMSYKWTQLQRKIIVSLLVNHRFWGRESRHVLCSLSQPAMATLGFTLSPEQWLALFQRVRAQGMGSTFPTCEEEENDPEFLKKKAKSARHCRIPGAREICA